MHITQKKLGLSIFTTIIILTAPLIPPLAQAEYTVKPSAPFERQFTFEIEPGQQSESSIIVKNLGNTSLKTTFYSADATHSNMGTFAITSNAKEQRHIGTWVKFANSNQIIPPKQEVEIPFTVQVPENTPPGNYGGGIAVEATPINDTNTFIENDEGDLEKVEEAKSQVQVTSRLITKIFVKIPGEKKTNVTWTNFSYTSKENGHRPSFSFSFKNTGNTIITAEPIIRFSGFPPLETKELKLSTITLQPGTAINDVIERWNDQPGIGIYSAKATVTFSEYDIIENTKINPWTEIRSVPLINLTPWYIIVIIILVVFGIIATITWRVIGKKIYLKNCYTYTVKQGETIVDIAKTHRANWKKIAKTNKLKPPFALQKDQKILVPKLKK